MAMPLPTVLACGAWLKNSACLLESGQARFSAVHGDLSQAQACQALESSCRNWLQQTQVSALAHDLHPDFFSSRLAQSLAHELGVPAIAVQHHHAHIAAVMAEHDLQEPVLGLALDGVGLGSDGKAWGGELLMVSPHDWQRLGHLWPLALPGGDTAAREPWRMAAAALHALGRTPEITARFAPLVGETAARTVQQMLERNLNCPMTSSTGRWFDAAAAALGLCLRQTEEAQAATALERLAQSWLMQHGDTANTSEVMPSSLAQLDLRPLLERLLDTAPADAGQAAAWFHSALADALAHWVIQAAQQTQLRSVCLGGGCFFNQLLTQRLRTQLERAGLKVFLPQKHSCGDAGLALGQAWVAAHSLNASAHTNAAVPTPTQNSFKPEQLQCA